METEELKKEEFESLFKERNDLKQELKELTEQYVATSNLLHEAQSSVPKGAATVLQVQKNKEVVNEINDAIESAQQNLSRAPEAKVHDEEEEIVDEKTASSLSKGAEQEVERQCNFLKKTMREISSPITNSMLQIFGSPDALSQIVAEKDYESLLVLSLKSISTTVVAEHAKRKQEEAGEADRKTKTPNEKDANNGLRYEELRSGPSPDKGQSILRNSIEEYINYDSKAAPNKMQRIDRSHETTAKSGAIGMAYNVPEKREQIRMDRKQYYQQLSRGRRFSPEGRFVQGQDMKRAPLSLFDPRQRSLKGDGSAKFEKWLRSYESSDAEGAKPIFNNYTKRTTDFFDPYLQFGGESMYLPSLTP